MASEEEAAASRSKEEEEAYNAQVCECVCGYVQNPTMIFNNAFYFAPF